MWQRGVLARMVIKNDKVRLGLWKLRFQDGLSPKECVDRLTDAKVSCKMQIYETLREFDGAVSWQYTKRGRKRSERVCAGGLTAGERFRCLNVLIDEDPDRSTVLAAARDDGAQAQRPSIHRQIGIAVNTSVHGRHSSHRRSAHFPAHQSGVEPGLFFLFSHHFWYFLSLYIPSIGSNVTKFLDRKP